ncbi:TPA: FRG domain-containing protein [Legionella bozemanae]
MNKKYNDTIEIDDAEKFLDELDPRHLSWKNWYFRGQPDSTYELIPSIWRGAYQDKFLKFHKSINNKTIQDNLIKLSEQKNYEFSDKEINNILTCHSFLKFENYILSKFYQIASKTDLNVPERLRSLSARRNDEYWKNDEMVDNFLMLVEGYIQYQTSISNHQRFSSCIIFDESLPQHYGLPTRILDWTSNSRKAIFFAAYYGLKNQKNNNDKISVYAYLDKADDKNQGMNPILFETNHDRNKNRFLHHQSGVFSRIYGEFYYFKHGKWPSIEKLYEETKGQFFELKKYNITSYESIKLLEMLEQCEISMSTLMPDYSHVAEQVNFQIENDDS